jgi:hypothetical protein
MHVQEITLSAVCEAGLRHDRCLGRVYSLLGDRDCGCTCHDPDPDEQQAAAELLAEVQLEAALEAGHGWDL